jgi:hypothetical protein
MLPLLLSLSWLAVLTVVVALCRAGACADAAAEEDLSRARADKLPAARGLTVWEQSDLARLERAAFRSRLQHTRRRVGHRPQRRPAACA